MKNVTLEEKLIAQAKNISNIYGSDNPSDVKIMLLEMQKEYLVEYIDSLIESLE